MSIPWSLAMLMIKVNDRVTTISDTMDAILSDCFSDYRLLIPSLTQGHLVIWAASPTAMNDILPEASGLGKPDYLLIVWL